MGLHFINVLISAIIECDWISNTQQHQGLGKIVNARNSISTVRTHFKNGAIYSNKDTPSGPI